MSAVDFPFELVNCFFTRSVVIAVANHDVTDLNKTTYQPLNNLSVSQIEDQQDLYAVKMTAVLNAEMNIACPYMIDMECIAYFRLVDKSKAEEEVMRGLTITGHSVTYGAIREAVSWITGRHPYGPFILGLSVLVQNDAEMQSKSK